METGESGVRGASAVRHVEEENMAGPVNVIILHLLTGENNVRDHSDKGVFVTRKSVQVKVYVTIFFKTFFSDVLNSYHFLFYFYLSFFSV